MVRLPAKTIFEAESFLLGGQLLGLLFDRQWWLLVLLELALTSCHDGLEGVIEWHVVLKVAALGILVSEGVD